MDCCVTPLPHAGLSLVQTTDFFYPLIDDPYIMGRIACANVLSDLYAMGVVRCDNMLMLLGVPTDMPADERNAVVPLMLSGFRDCANEAATSVQGGQTVKNPWMTVGGVATSVCAPTELILPDGAQPGDVLVLTKPLGTQMAVTLLDWLRDDELWARVAAVLSQAEARAAVDHATASMARLNLTGARLMHKHGARAATDVTGFGLLGHARNLAANQKAAVSFVIHNLPVIGKMAAVSEHVRAHVPRTLAQGFSPETSGGLLIAMPAAGARAFCEEMEQLEGWPAWIVGRVDEGDRSASIVDKPRIIDCPQQYTLD